MGADESLATLYFSEGQEVDTLARTLWGEARGEGAKGMRAVAHVIRNRVALARAKGGSWWGRDIISVCRKPYQFSCWNGDDVNRDRLMKAGENDPVFRLACAVAVRAVRSLDVFDITYGATHYHRYDIAPKWAKGRVPTVRIGAHVFYDLKEEV